MCIVVDNDRIILVCMCMCVCTVIVPVPIRALNAMRRLSQMLQLVFS